ncbi:Fe-S cluster assembly ATPase SufC [Salinisphaera hydrothermalis]|uniref:FeS assembly ATPase SufC n=1 Tax=Salinisphaera hydrothermalis (strain C41B8) TaxID=1304275 RepID=A0A084IJY0_SALHC|nr:Fe-S cluster assembly ATPase SufC [Salinisphaera hydrothermalis]KEZ77014.1 FeS assembly ATPase SufC [Salinisphaera hydrothermalis C41B8]
MISIKNLHAEVEGKPILRGIDLEIPDGEVHAIMGPNGSGKSTLASILAGREEYEVTEGSVTYKGKELLELDPDERACEGVFLGFQYPVEIPGVSNLYLLRAAVNARRKYHGEPEVDAVEFMQMVQEKIAHVGMSMDMVKRGVNEDFSGGEKKRNEIFQMLMLEPSLSVLDETDSGLDIDALKVVASGINRLRSPERSTILVTHYKRLLEHVVPDRVHVLYQGRIVRSGGPELADTLEEEGYANLETDEAAATS